MEYGLQAWMLASASLVLMTTTPALALLYGGKDVGMLVANPFELFGLEDVAFQLTFAVITAALISGAVADRLRFSAWLPFLPLSYFPTAGGGARRASALTPGTAPVTEGANA